MIWLLIAAVILTIISPLLWMRSSPRQKHIDHLRSYARTAGIQVILHRRPDARDDEVRLETVCYRLPWRGLEVADHWVIHRYSQRGWESLFSGWRWFQGEVENGFSEGLGEAIVGMPESASAILCNASGIGVTWGEREDTQAVAAICASLSDLRELLEKKSTKP